MDSEISPQAPAEKPALFTVREFCERNKWASQASIRWQIHRANETGFHRCIYRFGKRVLLDEAAVFAWMKASAQGGGE